MIAASEFAIVPPKRVRRARGNCPKGEIRVDVTLVNAVDEVRATENKIREDEIRFFEGNAMVDTGAIGTVIPRRVADAPGIPIIRKRSVTLADGSKKTLDVIAPVRFEFRGRETYGECLVMGDDILVGQTVLEMTDLYIDCANARVVPNPKHPDEPILYVK